MVTLSPNKLWHSETRRKLLQMYGKEENWEKISQIMKESYPDQQFTPTACNEEFERIIHSPLPTVETTPAQYNMQAIVDIWIKYFEEIIAKEQEQQIELCMVDIRNCYDVIRKTLTDQYSDEQLELLLGEAREYDAKRDHSVDAEINAIMRRLMAKTEAEKHNGEAPISHCSIPPTKDADVAPRGLETAFRTPSPEPSPIKTPIEEEVEEILEAEEFHPLSPSSISPTKTDELHQHIEETILSPAKSVDEAEVVVVTPTKATDELSHVSEVDLVSPTKAIEAVIQHTEENILSLTESADVKVPSVIEASRSPSAPSSPVKRRARQIKKPVRNLGRRKRIAATPKIKEEPVSPAKPAHISPVKTRRTRKSRTREEAISPSKMDDASLIITRTRRPLIKDEFVSPVKAADDISSPKVDSVSRPQRRKGRRVLIKEEPISPVKDDISSPKVDDVPRPQRRKGRRVLIKEELISPIKDDISLPQARSARRQSRSKLSLIPTEGRLKAEDLEARILLMDLWETIANNRNSGIFMRPVTESAAPGYSRIVKEKMDLTTLRKSIESGEITTLEQMKHRLMRMFANAVMYNPTRHEINGYAKEMARDTLAEFANINNNGITRSRNDSKNRKVDKERYDYINSTSRTVHVQKRATG